PGPVHRRLAARPAGVRRGPVAGHGGPAPVAGAAAGDERTGPGARAARRAVAAGVPEAARRAAARRPQPGEEDLTRLTLSGPGPGAAAATRRGRRRPGPGRPARPC